HAGNAFNVIPETAVLHGTVRTYSKSVYEMVPKKMKQLVEQIGLGFGANIDLEYKRIDKPTINDKEMADVVRKAAKTVLGEDCLTEENTRTMGGEDFSAFLMERPGCYFFIGSRNEEKGFVHPHHSSFFDFDEDSLPIGLSVMKEVVHTYLSEF
ncbi:M20/M25/M40 family metallo-hydrolase, partial [Leptospira jelokensis]